LDFVPSFSPLPPLHCFLRIPKADSALCHSSPVPSNSIACRFPAFSSLLLILIKFPVSLQLYFPQVSRLVWSQEGTEEAELLEAGWRVRLTEGWRGRAAIPSFGETPHTFLMPRTDILYLSPEQMHPPPMDPPTPRQAASLATSQCHLLVPMSQSLKTLAACDSVGPACLQSSSHSEVTGVAGSPLSVPTPGSQTWSHFSPISTFLLTSLPPSAGGEGPGWAWAWA
jgi:hypothetical protein